MADGATLIAPETVWFAWDTEIGRDVTDRAECLLRPRRDGRRRREIRAFSHIEGAAIGAGCEIGPFARLRPGTVLGEKAKVGNFVETKKAMLGQGRQGQSPDLSRRCDDRRGREHRRGDDHLQL